LKSRCGSTILHEDLQDKFKFAAMTYDAWPFDQPQNCAVLTLRSIVFDGQPILYVFHDPNDHGWQFLDGRPIDMAHATLVSLKEIVNRDSSVLELADMPPGWSATRATSSSPWRRLAPESS
jgi:hypothetical protein